MIQKKEDPRYEIDYSKPVFVYRNLHKNCWSVKQGGLVKAHASWITLNECEFIVSQAGRNRVLKEKRKNVHAGIKGFLAYHPTGIKFVNEATYNPYKYENFVDKSSEKKLVRADNVKMEPNRVLYR